MSNWYFESRNSYGVFSNPKHDEHFSHVRGIVDSIIRETLQNSGDASNPSTGKPVRVKVRFGKIDEAKFKSYLPGLTEHIASFQGLAQILNSTNTVPFLVIEDFETHGLRGSTNPETAGIDSSYVSFWHRYGDSGKSNEHGGRHGLGKSTIASASRLQMFFGASVSSESNPRQVLLQGQICLKPHRLTSKGDRSVVYDAYGLWYNEGSKGHKSPFIDREAAGFLHDFKLERERNPGLSLVIPFPQEEITPEALVVAIIENCFHQIIAKQMVVVVDKTVLDAKSIKAVAKLHSLNNLSAAMSLSEAAAEGNLTMLAPRANTAASRLAEDHFSPADLATMRARWTDGKVISIRLPVVIRRKGFSAENGEVQLYARREQNEELSRETYIRGRVSVPHQTLPKGSNCVCLLVADKGIASTFLGDSEPPAHDRWLRRRLTDYRSPEEALNRIKTAVRGLIGIVDTSNDEKAIKDAFSEYLWAPTLPDPDDDVRPVKPPKPQPEKAPSIELRAKPLHNLKRIEGGFAYSYSLDEEASGAGLARAKIYASYRRRATKVPTKAKFQDFDDDFKVEEMGTASLDQANEPRRLVFQLSDVAPGYELRVTGFDPNRDIELRMEASDQ